MIKKLSMVAAVTAALLFPTLAVARPHARAGGVHRNVQVNKNIHVNKSIHVNKNVSANRRLVVGRRYHGGIWYGHVRRRWHGVWYAYGVGPCWLSTPIGYVWTCE